MKTFIKYSLILLLVGCGLMLPLSHREKTWISVVCDNLICFPDYISRVGPDFKTKERCEKFIEGKTSREDMEFYYCRET